MLQYTQIYNTLRYYIFNTFSDERNRDMSNFENSNGCNKVIDRAIKNAHNLANGVQVYYADGRDSYVIENQNMSLGYILTRDKDQQISYIKNTKGETYI